MNARKRLFPAGIGLKAAAVVVATWVLILASHGAAHAQYEPEFFTARRAFHKALDSTPADVHEMMSIMAGYFKHRQWLEGPWAQRLVTASRADVARLNQMADMFGAFSNCFAVGNMGKQSAALFLQLHEELLGRQPPQKEIDKAAAIFHERLSQLPQAGRDRFQEIGRDMNAAIKAEAERANQRIMDAIKKQGGSIRRDPKQPGKHLAKLTDLRDLTLDVPPGRFGDGNPITDPGLEHLRGLKHLECLTISATNVSSAGVKRLQQALPKLKIKGARS